MFKRITALLLVLSMLTVAYADGTEFDKKGYIAMGADLTKQQQKMVVEQLGVENTDEYEVSYCTNEQEHEAFDKYLPQNVIGTRALSSILMVPAKEGDGITVTMHNITYCTKEMYQNALISAGVSDVDVTIAAPIPVSGTCALVGAMNAYATLTGVEIDEESADAATNELVTTGEVGDAIGDNDAAAEMMATLKQQVAESDKKLSEEELNDAVEKICVELKITLDDDLKREVVALLQKLQNTNLNAESLKTQASELYEKVSDTMSNMDLSMEQAQGFLERLFQMVKDFFRSVTDFLGIHNADQAQSSTEIDPMDGNWAAESSAISST